MDIDIEYDAAKNVDNIAQRGLSFELVRQFDWLSARLEEDTRRDYGERRFQATGFIGAYLYVVIFANRSGKVRVISLRRANKREKNRYVNQT